MKKIIDLTHTFTASMPVHPYDEQSSIKKTRNIAEHFYNDCQLSSGMHVGTHIDGPGHLTESNVRMSDITPDRFVGKGYLIDARNKTIDASLLKDMPFDKDLIVLILTGFDKKFGTDEYFKKHPVIPTDVAQELVNHGIKMIGMDCFSPDNYPFECAASAFSGACSGVSELKNINFPTHRVPDACVGELQTHKMFFKHNILIIENLTNLESLLGIKNFTVVALPLKTEIDSALARVIAIEERNV